MKRLSGRHTNTETMLSMTVEARTTILKNLAWPATAGNVAWSFFTLPFECGVTAATLPLIIGLFLMAIYLSISWLRVPDAVSPKHFRFDLLHLAGIIVFAHMAQYTTDYLPWALAFVLLLSILGHCLEIWEPSNSLCRRLWLVGANALGIGVLAVGWWTIWSVPVALLIVITLWVRIRWPEIMKH